MSSLSVSFTLGSLGGQLDIGYHPIRVLPIVGGGSWEEIVKQTLETTPLEMWWEQVSWVVWAAEGTGVL